ncbi:hypothetical protein ACT4XR_20400 (plasmid) [Acinetobacter baumannii]|uniref:hypothetical protein n=1 Tax=Acinetobacter baumannii TaxID=470 RepID=UPI003891A1B8
MNNIVANTVNSYEVKTFEQVKEFIATEKLKYNFYNRCFKVVSILNLIGWSPLIVCGLTALVSLWFSKPELVFFSTPFMYCLFLYCLIVTALWLYTASKADQESDLLIKKNFPNYFNVYGHHNLLDEESLKYLLSTEVTLDEYKIIKSLAELSPDFNIKLKEIMKFRNGIFTIYDYRVLNCKRLLSMSEQETNRSKEQAEIDEFKKEIIK